MADSSMDRLHVATATIIEHDVHNQTRMTSTMTTISIRRKTKEKLRKLAAKGQTYDEVIRGLIELTSIKELEERWNRILKDEVFIPLDKS
jgi:predicted CopG family antitoxin